MAASLESPEQKLGFRPLVTLPDGQCAIVERDCIAVHLFVDKSRNLDELHAELHGRGAVVAQQIRKKHWGIATFA
jgi:hypothetical protein